MSEQKSPLVNLAATIMATVTCCTTETKEQNTNIHIDGSTVYGANLDERMIKSNSTVSQDLSPILEKIPEHDV